MAQISESSSTKMNEANKGPSDRTFPEYFTQLAANYSRSTGDSTYKVVQTFLENVRPSFVNATSIVNDNACGPATATAAIIDYLGAEPARVEATDSVPAMVDAAEHRARASGWKNAKATEMDSHELKFPDNIFTISISNISVQTYNDPLQCLREMLRTLKPGGTAIITAWKRFAAAEMIHAAQRKVRSDAELIKLPRPEFMREGYLHNLVTEAGFANVKTDTVSVLCKGSDIEGVRQFVLGDFTRSVREHWTDDEKAKWPTAVDEAVHDEIDRHGGVKFDAWVVTGSM